jgi:rhodanese-related sulfurtransferase
VAAHPGLELGIGVASARQGEIHAFLDEVAPSAGRLGPGDLKRITTAVAARRELWEDLVVHDPDTRWYLPLYRSEDFDVWLLAWERDQDTDWHDHGGSSGSFAVADGTILEQYRTGSGLRIARRKFVTGSAAAFGPSHVHDVHHFGGRAATTIHAYSPPLVAMTYYSPGPHGLVARETVAVEGPEGPRGQGGNDAVVASLGDRPAGAGIDALLEQSRRGLRRLGPDDAAIAVANGAVIVDIRPVEQRIAEGEVPGAVVIARNVLEWRLDPRSDARLPGLARSDAHIIVMCSEGYASSLAAASLRSIGIIDATDLAGGFVAWRNAGLLTVASSSR